MDRAHDVTSVEFRGPRLILVVDGRRYEADLAQHSVALARATQAQREHFVVSAAGYGIHWPDLDEDLSIDGLIGVTHSCPIVTAAASLSGPSDPSASGVPEP
jgi:hypothetical protein